MADLFCHQTGTGNSWVYLGEGGRRLDAGVWSPGFRRAGTDPGGLVQTGWCTGVPWGMTDIDGDGRSDVWCQLGPSVYYAKANPVVPSSGPVTWAFGTTALAASGFCGYGSTMFNVSSAGR